MPTEKTIYSLRIRYNVYTLLGAFFIIYQAVLLTYNLSPRFMYTFGSIPAFTGEVIGTALPAILSILLFRQARKVKCQIKEKEDQMSIDKFLN